MIKIIESPREAMQGIVPFIPSDVKAVYINALLGVGFDTVEVGSFVSPKVIPQMSDTMEVLKQTGQTKTRSKRMVLVVNQKGADVASTFDGIDTISYPFSISPRFSELNLNSTPEKQLGIVNDISNLCLNSNKAFVVYISMAFGNPYGDEWSLEILSKWIRMLSKIGIRTIPFSNVSLELDKTLIAEVFSSLIPQYPEIEFGLHLHTSNDHWHEKVKAAYDNGCRRFDAVMQGMGGCPMTGKELLGNLATENIIEFLKSKNEIPEGFDETAFWEASRLASELLHNTSQRRLA